MLILRFLFFHLVRDPIYLFWYIVRRLQREYKIGVRFYSMEQLFSLLKNQRKSLIRMGDGEAYIIHHGNMGYEVYSPELRKDLLAIIKDYREGCSYILSIPEIDINKSNKELSNINRLELWLPLKILYSQKFPQNISYGDALTFYKSVFRPFFSSLIEKRKLIIVTRYEIIDNLNQDYLQSAYSYRTIVTPDIYSYPHKTEIIERIHDCIPDLTDPDILLILACGPLSKVLAYEFSNQGIQSIDIGRGIELISFRSNGDLESQL